MALSALAGSLVFEPTKAELEAFSTSPDNDFHRLQPIFTWAGFTWGVKYQMSPGGVLLTNLGADWVALPGSDSADPKCPNITLDEFAATPSEELERLIDSENWWFAISSEPSILAKAIIPKEELCGAKPLHRTKARKAHLAANIACGLIIPRSVQQEADAKRDQSMDVYRREKMALLKEQSAPKNTDLVAVHEIADVTKVKSIPLWTASPSTRNSKISNGLCTDHLTRGRNARSSNSQ